MPRILVVDDQENIRQLYQDFLSKKGYKVETAENGRKALESVDIASPDLILLDMNMPVMDGKEFLKLVKADEKHKAIPVLLITAVENISEISECIGLGAMGYIEKTTSLSEVVNKIGVVLNTIVEKPSGSSLTDGPKKMQDLDLQ